MAAPLILLTCINLSLIQRINTLLVILLAAAFTMLILMSAGHMDMQRTTYSNWSFVPATLPIIVTAFHFHNIIPTISADLKWDMRIFRRAVLLGMLLAFIMNILWILAGIGVMPLTGDNSILEAWNTNTPATVPMGAIIGKPFFTLLASFFALTAISTSFLANGLGLQSFIRDLLANTFGIDKKPLIMTATFLPPLLTALVYPDIFLKALDVVGGIGIVALFGILPTMIVVMDQKRTRSVRILCLAALIFAAVILGLEVLKEAGILHLKPWVDYHSVDF